jgi:uncharacterized membrane-anchored protein
LPALSRAIWCASEHTLFVHGIVKKRREFFYWLTVCCTLALASRPVT